MQSWQRTRACVPTTSWFFPRIANPVVVVAVLVATSWIDRIHGCMVGCNQVFMFTAEADLTEWTVSIVKEHRSHDIFYKMAKQLSLSSRPFLRNFWCWVVNRFHKGITSNHRYFIRQSFNHWKVTSRSADQDGRLFCLLPTNVSVPQADPNWAQPHHRRCGKRFGQTRDEHELGVRLSFE